MNQHRPALNLTEDTFYPRLKAFIIEATGMVFFSDKDEDLSRILGHRFKDLGLSSCSRYLDLLLAGDKGKRELDTLIAELTIGETYFFRHKEQFDALRDTVLPEVIERNRESRKIRIWSAGCATGAEPYSVAMLIRKNLGHLVKDWTIDILATDINKKFLAIAKRGIYRPWALRVTSDSVRDACFKDLGGDQWELKSQYRDAVTFQYHNLVENPFPSLIDNLFAFDVILCRNVTIYFERETVRRLINQFHDSLVDGGWLLAGHSETDLELFRAFQTINVPGAVVYQRSAEEGAQGSIVDLRPAGGEGTPDAWQPSLLEPLEQPDGPSLLDSVAEEPPSEVPEADTGRLSAVVQTGHESDLRQIRRLADLGQWWEAIGRCEELLDQDRSEPAVHLYYALILEQMDNMAAAEQALRQAIFLDRNFVLPHYHMGLFLQRKGDLGGARKSFATVERLLADVDEATPLDDEDDGMTAGQLKSLARMHLEVMEQS